MTIKYWLVFLIICSSISSVIYARPQTLDQIVAIVNDDVITDSELQQAMLITKAQNTAANVSQDSIQKQAINQLINTKLQLQMAKQAGVKITDEELTQIIRRIASQNNVSIKELYQHINAEGVPTNDYLKQMREQLMLQKLQQHELIGKITVSPQEVKSFIAKQSLQPMEVKTYEIEDILLPFNDSSENEVNLLKQQAKTILAKIHQGKTLTQAVDLVNNPTIQKQNLGLRTLTEMPTAFVPFLSQFNTIDDVVGPVQTANGFHLLHLLNWQKASSSPIDNKQIESQLMAQKFEEALEDWLSRTRAQAYIQRI
jgi:peptidyl-prolyl cis-trans isomerase SurA